ncbi:MAG: aminoglycoside phosphotransferase family protein [Chloroflexota bacterium]
MPPPFIIPSSLIAVNTEQRGLPGVEWLARLPDLLAYCERRWSLSIGPPFSGLSYNYAAPATRQDGTTVVVKICYPDKEFFTETDVLTIYAGKGSVQLLDLDNERAIMLLEHLVPGNMLVTVQSDEEAISIAASVMKQLWRPAPATHSFPTVAGWASGLSKLRPHFGGTGPFPEKLVDLAERLFAELLASMDEPVVLHGDLHHFNILSATRQPWLSIDPKGVVGEAAYETGALIRNPMPALYSVPNLASMLSRRMGQLAEELGFDRQRIRGWAIAQAVLAGWWFFEDSGLTEIPEGSDWQRYIEFTETLAGTR